MCRPEMNCVLCMIMGGTLSECPVPAISLGMGIRAGVTQVTLV